MFPLVTSRRVIHHSSHSCHGICFQHMPRQPRRSRQASRQRSLHAACWSLADAVAFGVQVHASLSRPGKSGGLENEAMLSNARKWRGEKVPIVGQTGDEKFQRLENVNRFVRGVLRRLRRFFVACVAEAVRRLQTRVPRDRWERPHVAAWVRQVNLQR